MVRDLLHSACACLRAARSRQSRDCSRCPGGCVWLASRDRAQGGGSVFGAYLPVDCSHVAESTLPSVGRVALPLLPPTPLASRSGGEAQGGTLELAPHERLSIVLAADLDLCIEQHLSQVPIAIAMIPRPPLSTIRPCTIGPEGLTSNAHADFTYPAAISAANRMMVPEAFFPAVRVSASSESPNLQAAAAGAALAAAALLPRSALVTDFVGARDSLLPNMSDVHVDKTTASPDSPGPMKLTIEIARLPGVPAPLVLIGERGCVAR